MKAYADYFTWGGLPEGIPLPVKRSYLSSVFQKIYLGDIVQRNGISNPKLLQLMIKKMAESVRQPVSYNRISKILSSVSGKISVPTVSNYVGFSEDAWLLLRLHNEDNERVFFYNANIEVDFYVPEDELAVQVSYALTDADTLAREVGALAKLPNVHSCRRRIIVTYDEEGTLTDKYGSIEVIPCWKWLLNPYMLKNNN